LLIEWWIVFLLVVMIPHSACAMIGLSDDSRKIPLSSYVQFTIWMGFMAATPWLFFFGIDIGKKPGCDIKACFFGNIYLYHHGWQTAAKVISIFATILATCSIFGCLSILFLHWDIFIRRISERWMVSSEDDEDEDDAVSLAASTKSSISDTRAGRFFLLSVFILPPSIAIWFIEKTIQANNLDMSSGSISAAGQLIPLVVGAYILFTTIMTLLKRPFVWLVKPSSKCISLKHHRQNGDPDVELELGQRVEGEEGSRDNNAREDQKRTGHSRSQEEEDSPKLLGGSTKDNEEEPQRRHRRVSRCQTL
jgi:hypothetical protein